MHRTSIRDLALSGHELADEQLRLAAGARFKVTSKVTGKATGGGSNGGDWEVDGELDF
jgi:hypothetical protein